MSLFVEKITQWINKLVSLVILLVMLRLVLYMLTNLYVSAQRMASGNMWLANHDAEMLDWVVFFIVMVKAYKVLVSYTKYQHVSIRYVTELVIITCFLEFIFEQDLSEQIRIILGAVGIATLFLYLYFYTTFKEMDIGH
ncbi:hypothetical protein [Methyloprofundus sp.]|uniref:hypothetical protein n=1 Tax=Methyloprofundus sp. TaxID=2020875 RepID=UPI003D0D5F1F